MATVFTPPVAPSVGSSKQVEFRTLRAKYGDGYEQRAPDGINTNSRKVTLVWATLSDTDADTIEGFIQGLGGYIRFLYTVPGESTQLSWFCAKYSRSMAGRKFDSINAEFEQVFDI